MGWLLGFHVLYCDRQTVAYIDRCYHRPGPLTGGLIIAQRAEDTGQNLLLDNNLVFFFFFVIQDGSQNIYMTALAKTFQPFERSDSVFSNL